MMPRAAAITAAVLTIVLAAPALAAVWCVPHDEIGGQCQKTSPSIQRAIDLGAPGDIIRVGPGNPAERITITKRVRLIGLPGHLITDARLDPGGALLTFAGTIGSPLIERLQLDVVTSDAGIVVPNTVTNAQFKGVRVMSAAHPRPAYGFQANGSSRTYFIGSLGTTPRVSGFEVGMELNHVMWHDVEAGTEIEDNGVGLRVTHGKGQIFWNVFRNNEVALEVRGAFHTDINANTFIDNGLAMLWGWAAEPHPESGVAYQKVIEFNHAVLVGNAELFRVETAPGVFSADYRDDPGCAVQWTNMTVEEPGGAAQVLPNHTTGRRC
jgi:hypothetical protein